MTALMVRYAGWAALERDCAAQLARNGLYVQRDLGLPQFAAVAVSVCAPSGVVFALPAEIVTVVPGAACAVQFKAAARPALEQLLQHVAARPAGAAEPAGADPTVETADDAAALRAAVVEDADLRAALADDDDDDANGAPSDDGGGDDAADDAEVQEADEPLAPFADQQSVQAQLDGMTVTQKRQAAMHGTKEMRMLLIRDNNKGVHAYVVRNPAISLDEVEQIAKLTSVSPEVLHIICRNPDWMRSATVVRNLMRNPKTPVPDAIGLIEKLPESEIRFLVKSPSVRTPIKTAARKKLHGNA